MLGTSRSSLRGHSAAAAILLVALIATWLSYHPGTSGGTYFDDEPNLGGLSDVQDFSSAVNFVLTGEAGPTGRPVALATFAAQAYAWQDNSAVYLRTNVLIHLLNGALVAWFLYLIGIARGQPEDRAGLVASIGSAIWMLMPILASSSLLIIQRMTTLSATFLLSGLTFYLYVRRKDTGTPYRKLLGMTLALGVGSLLAGLTKENGFLLVPLVLALEFALLDRPRNITNRSWRAWVWLVLGVPTFALFAYLVTRVPYSDSVVLRRGFTGLERLSTEAVALWQYLYNAFIPHVPNLGPFHDDYALRQGLMDPPVLLALATWLASLCAAIHWRRRFPLLAFGVLWYLAGHALESTTIPLELYFEHRNYVPLIGPVYAVAAAVFSLDHRWRRGALALLAVYSLVLAGVLFSLASLWGQRALAAEMWVIYSPKSIRAAEMLARQMERTGNPDVAMKVFREVRDQNPEAKHLDLQIMLFQCQLEPDRVDTELVQNIETDLRNTPFTHAAPGLVRAINYLVRNDKCPSAPPDIPSRFAQSFLENPRFQGPELMASFHVIRGENALQLERSDSAVSEFRKAVALDQNGSALRVSIQVLSDAGLHDAAASLLDAARKRTIDDPVRARLWRAELERLSTAVASEHPAPKSSVMAPEEGI